MSNAFEDILDEQEVIVYRNGLLDYEGEWGKRPAWLDGHVLADWYLLGDVESADIIVVAHD